MSKELDELQEIARIATRKALEAYEPIPAEWVSNLALGTFFEGEDRIFELYISKENPRDTIVISSARINRNSREIQVTISNLPKKGSQ